MGHKSGVNALEGDAPDAVGTVDRQLLALVEDLKTKSLRNADERRKPLSNARPIAQGTPSIARGQMSRVLEHDALPIWPESKRAIPSELVRCSLFSVAQARKRKSYSKAVIASMAGIEVTYSGEELRQRDEDVFLQLLHLSVRAHPQGDVVFSAADLLSSLGWTRNGRSYDELADTITRLKATALVIRAKSPDGEHEVLRGCSLVGDFTRAARTRDPGTAAWHVRIDPKINSLFMQRRYTLIDWEQRMQLSPVAKWFHSFYHSHNAPHAMFVATLHRLCGSGATSMRTFRATLRQALDELVDVAFLSSWQIDASDKVIVIRTTSPVPAR